MSFVDVLNKLIVEHNLNNSELARAVNVSDVTVGKWRKGETGLSFDNAIAIADYFRISLDDLTGNKQYLIGRDKVRLPVIGTVSKWGVHTKPLWTDDYITVERSNLHDYPQEECYAFQLSDDSFEPDYIAGFSYPIFHQQSQCAEGDTIIMKNKNSDEYLLKVFHWTDAGIELTMPGLRTLTYRKQDINYLEIQSILIDWYIAL